MKKYEIHHVESEMWKCSDEYFPNQVAFRIQWSANVGFGELTFVYNTKEHKWVVDDEFMSEEFCLAVLQKWLHGVYTGDGAETQLYYDSTTQREFVTKDGNLRND